MDNLDKSEFTRDLAYELPDTLKYSFFQLFDINEVQQIQDSFSEATGVASIITEVDGTPITRPSGFSFFCNEIVRKTEKGLCNCIKSDAFLGMPDTSGPRFQRCLSGGLLDGGASIMVGNHHIANWLIGQVMDEDADINEMYKYCTEIGADREEFNEALKKVYRMPKERFVGICNFLYLNAKMLSTQASRNIVQQEEIRMRKETEQKYRLLFDNAAEVITVIQDNRIKMCNPMGPALTGYSHDEIMSLPLINFIHPDDRHIANVSRFQKKNWEEVNRKYNFRVIKKDNTFSWVEMNTINILWEGKPAALSFFADITIRKGAEDALRLSEEKYRLLTEFASDVIWVYNTAKNRFTYMSPTVFQLRGLTVEEAMNETLEQSMSPHSYNEVKRHLIKGTGEIAANLDNPKSYVNQIQQVSAAGAYVWVEVSSRFRCNADGDIEVVGISRNIEARKKAEAEILYLSYRDQLTGLANRRFYEEKLKQIDSAENLPVTLVMVDLNGLKLTNDAFGHSYGDLLLMKASNILSDVCTGDDTAARIGGDEFMLILPKCSTARAENIVAQINKAVSGEKINNIILSVSIGFAVKSDPVEDINDIFRKAEDNMYKSKLYESSSMRSNTIDLIMNTLYEKNNREMHHSTRVSQICEAIAAKMDFDQDDINQIRLAGLMHDIGKIGIDEQILNKPGMLTSIEWLEMHRHSEIGYRILSSVNEFSEIAEHVLAHHERWDGKGYPKGLSGEEIPLKSRIIAIADSYDAMTSDRTYRKGLSIKEAAEEIKKCSGTQFDAVIAKIFVEKVLEMPWD